MKSYIGFAIDTAKEAGKILMDNYGKMQKLEWKLRTNFKTEVDDICDKFIRQKIQESFPKHNIYSEEQDVVDKKSEFSWIIDPLDGTIPYRYGISDHFSVCVALAREKIPFLGVVYAPKRKELYTAEIGKGAFCNNIPIYASEEENINHVIMGLDNGKETRNFKRASIAKYFNKLLTPKGISCSLSYGCASVPLCLVASGKLHAYLALSLELWDMAAAVIINKEAGARVTTLKGKEWCIDDASILVANTKLHSKLIKLINS